MPQYIASSRECSSPAAAVAPTHDKATAARADESEACGAVPPGAAKPRTIAVMVTADPMRGRRTRCPFGVDPAHSCGEIYIRARTSYGYGLKRGKLLASAYGLGDFVEGFRVLDRGEIARL